MSQQQGLDPRAERDYGHVLSTCIKKTDLSTILVTHSMEDAAKYADEIVVMHKGTVL